MDRKETVLEIVQNNPGIRFNEIMRMSNIRNGTLSHYVKKLEDEKNIQLERTPRVTRLYPKGISKKEATICKYLTMSSHKKMILFLMKKKSATSQEIREYVNKVSASHTDGSDNSTKSPVAGKNDMGGSSSNIAQGGEESGRPAPKAKDEDAGNVNKPGAKAKMNAAPKAQTKAGDDGSSTKSTLGS